MQKLRQVMWAALVLAGLVAGCSKESDRPASAPPVPKAEIIIEGVPPEDQIILRDLLRVDGVMIRGTQHVAAINHQVVRPGEQLRLKARNRRYNLQVLAITERRILVKAVEQESAPPRPGAPPGS